MSVVSQTHADQGCLMRGGPPCRKIPNECSEMGVCGAHLLMHVVLSELASACHYLSLTYTCHPKIQLTITSTAAGRREKPGGKSILNVITVRFEQVLHHSETTISNYFTEF